MPDDRDYMRNAGCDSEDEREDERGGQRKDGRSEPKHEHVAIPARITLLYESDDGRLCLFEDAQGHVTAVPAALLA